MIKPRIRFLPEDKIEAIHTASLKVLENTGIKVESKQALDTLKEAGAKVDYVKHHVTIPRNLVEEALNMAPKAIKYAARNPKNDFMLDKRESHFCADGGSPFTLDWENSKNRYSTAADIARSSVIADYLDHVHIVSMESALDMPEPMQGIIGMYTRMSNTEKHFTAGALTARQAQYEIEIAAGIVGSTDELRKRPIFSTAICPISPLSYTNGRTDAALEYSKAGIPVIIWSMPMLGETSPATLAGAMVIDNAESLGYLVILQFANPGAPVVYSADVGTVDFKTGAGIHSPEAYLMSMGLAQLSQYYGLPTQVEASCSASKIPDVQDGYEKAILLITYMLMDTPPDIILGLGALEDSRMGSAEAMVIDNEIIDYALGYARGLEVNDNTLALDVIHKVGPGGTFLGEKHTLQHFRERWAPKIGNMDSFETWEQKGSRRLDEVAHEKIKEILATHKPAPIPQDAQKEISKILKRAERELLN
ncbi:MAG: trimethylamine methyltransferase family protein [Dehalococcoidia bacterium]|nr:trimethylamine methyltransferase family protein [Dehalococcoidia bacterium]